MTISVQDKQYLNFINGKRCSIIVSRDDGESKPSQ